MKVHSRQEWGARPAKTNTAPQGPANIREAFVHHSASPGRGIVTASDQHAALRAIQDFHMDTRGWADIAYHFIVFQAPGMGLATIYQGRPLTVVPAAQEGHNTNTLTVCIVQIDPEPLKWNTRWRVGRLIRHYKQVRRVRGHYEVFQTECPGSVIRAQLDRIAKIAGKDR